MQDDFSTLFDFLPLGAYRTTPDGRQLRSNRPLWLLNGYDSEADHVAGVRDIATEWYVDPQRRDAFKAQLERDGFVRDFVSEVYRHRTRERIWISENAHVVRDAAGQIVYYEGTVEEITARVEAQERLRASEERLKLTLEASGDGMWDWDIERGVETYSDSFLALYGFSAQDIAADPGLLDARTHPDDIEPMRRAREEHFAGRSPRYVNEHRIRCQDGRWKWILSRGLVIQRDAAGRPLRMVGTHTDLTASKEADALRAERDRAEAADRAKTELLSHVSHELRTPLNGVLGFAQLLQHTSDLPSREREWVQHILSSGRHLLGMVDDLLDLASAQSGALKLVFAAAAPAELLQAAWAMLSPRAAERGLHYECTVDADPALQVQADQRRLTQVLANLLSNAVKYNRAGGSVRVAAERSGSQVRISVSDDGPGLDAQQLAHIFQPFQRLGAERSSVEGTGLGLALSQQLCAAMGGELSVRSAPGEGTTFSVMLRAAD